MAFVITVVLLGVSGGIIALFVRGIGAERGAIAGFSVVSAVAVVQSGWLPLKSPGRAGYLAISEMHVIEERKRNFERFPSSDCVQLQRSFPWHSWGQIWGHQVDSPLSC
jgi:hypothetical protein